MTEIFRLPLILLAALAAMIVVVTEHHHPWNKKFGTPAWDYSLSFATNLSALTAAINSVLAAVTLMLDPSKKTTPMLAAGIFAVLSACSPLIATAWKTTENKTFFAGIVAAILMTAFGFFGQIELLGTLIKSQGATAAFQRALYFADFAVFVYCLSSANVLAKLEPPASVDVDQLDLRLLRGSQPDRWILP